MQRTKIRRNRNRLNSEDNNRDPIKINLMSIERNSQKWRRKSNKDRKDAEYSQGNYRNE